MLTCRPKHLVLLKSWLPISPYFKVSTLRWEEGGTYTAWTGILDNKLMAKLEEVEEIHSVCGETTIKALIKGSDGICKGAP